MNARLATVLALLLAALPPRFALAQCSGAGGVPFNCAPGNTPNLNDYVLGGSNTAPQSGDTVRWTWRQIFTAFGGGVTSLSVANANGLAGTATSGPTPVLTLSTTVSGLLKGNGTSIGAAVAGTDYIPPSGGAFTGEITTAASTTGSAGFNLPPGTAPASPVDGDMWATSLGVYAQVNGTTVGPFGTSGGGDVTASGTPTAGQVAEWVSASSIQGVTGTGTGAPVMQTSPTLVTPDLGTPSTLNLANATALPFSTGLTGTILASQMLALPTGDVYQGNGSNQPAAVAMSAAIDAAFGSAQGSLLTRNATVWTPLTPGVAGYFLQTQGPSANLDWASASGGSGCTISGGAQYQIVVNNGASGCSSSANASVEVGALTLGQSGTPGSIVMGNATSGTLTLEPATGALGSDVAVLPANSGTISELNLAQTYTAAQIFANSDLLLRGSSTGATTFASANSTATNYTITVPAVTDTMLTSTGNGSALTGLTWSQIGTTPNTLAGYGITNGLSTSLANTNILVGNGSGNAAAVAVSGDATLANTGALTVTKSNGSSFGTAAFDDTGTSGATVPLNNGNNNSTGNNIHSGAETFNGTVLVAMRKVTASGDITVSGTADYFICVDKGTGAATAVNLPASPGTGLTYLIKDCKGDAATNNITITPNAGDIDGSSTYVISNNYGSVAVTYNGSAWSLN